MRIVCRTRNDANPAMTHARQILDHVISALFIIQHDGRKAIIFYRCICNDGGKVKVLRKAFNDAAMSRDINHPVDLDGLNFVNTGLSVL